MRGCVVREYVVREYVVREYVTIIIASSPSVTFAGNTDAFLVFMGTNAPILPGVVGLINGERSRILLDEVTKLSCNNFSVN